jgi:hypothetical protein
MLFESKVILIVDGSNEAAFFTFVSYKSKLLESVWPAVLSAIVIWLLLMVHCKLVCRFEESP